MSEQPPSFGVVPASPAPLPSPRFDRTGLPTPMPTPPAYERPLAAIRRYKWLVLGVIALAVVVGIVATRTVKPVYEVRATIWIEPETPVSNVSGPIRSRELLNSSAWVELLRSYRIVDAVVQKLALYVQPENSADLELFSNFAIADRFIPGKYQLKIDRSKDRWNLALRNGAFSDSGSAGTPVGARAGLSWVLLSTVFAGDGRKTVNFTLSTPRETAVELMQQLSAELPEKSNFLW